MVDTISNMQLADINSKHHGRNSLRDIIHRTIGLHFYPNPGSQNYKLLRLEQFHGTIDINVNNKENNDTTFEKIL